VWAYDFVEDRTHDGRKFRMLCIVDEFTRESLAIRVALAEMELALRTTAREHRCNDRQGDASMTNAPERGGERRLDQKLLEILVCPLTKTSLDYDAERQELISRTAGLAYPIRDGIPIMLPEEARKLDEG
jgi:uncharacterized protein